jgi:hypothetical protein
MNLNNSQYRNKSLINIIVSHFARFFTICYYFAHLHRFLFVSERISCQIWLLTLVSASNVSIVHVSTPNGNNFSLLLTELLRNLTFYYVSQLLFFHRIYFLFLVPMNSFTIFCYSEPFQWVAHLAWTIFSSIPWQLSLFQFNTPFIDNTVLFHVISLTT